MTKTLHSIIGPYSPLKMSKDGSVIVFGCGANGTGPVYWAQWNNTSNTFGPGTSINTPYNNHSWAGFGISSDNLIVFMISESPNYLSQYCIFNSINNNYTNAASIPVNSIPQVDRSQQLSVSLTNDNSIIYYLNSLGVINETSITYVYSSIIDTLSTAKDVIINGTLFGNHGDSTCVLIGPSNNSPNINSTVANSVIIGNGAAGCTANNAPESVIIGHNAGFSIANATGNVLIGSGAGLLTNGQSNTCVGTSANATNTVGSFNTILGANGDVASNNLTYATAIGAGAIVTASNTIQLGRATDNISITGYLKTQSTVYNCSSSITTTTALSTPLQTLYFCSASSACTVTLPAPSTTLAGTIVHFRKTATSTGAYTFTAGTSKIAPYNNVTLGNGTLTTAQYSTSFACNGTNWYQLATM